jgi:hypothetical protein
MESKIALDALRRALTQMLRDFILQKNIRSKSFLMQNALLASSRPMSSVGNCIGNEYGVTFRSQIDPQFGFVSILMLK